MTPRFAATRDLPWPPPPQPALAADEIDLLWIDAAVQAELPRRARTQALLQQALAAWLPPSTTQRFAREAHGKPYLALPDAPDFNLSDTRGGSVLAIAGAPRVGVDLERMDRRPPVLALARRWFSAAEADQLAALDEDAAAAAFMRLWTAKEASCKATGTGIFGWLPHWQFDLASLPPRPTAIPAHAGEASQWWHVRVEPSPGYTCVIAAQGGARRLRQLLRLGVDQTTG